VILQILAKEILNYVMCVLSAETPKKRSSTRKIKKQPTLAT
jgi:hypothetical protein